MADRLAYQESVDGETEPFLERWSSSIWRLSRLDRSFIDLLGLIELEDRYQARRVLGKGRSSTR
jgi:hypothetical protein